MSLYRHLPHPHIEDRKKQGPVRVADQLPRESIYQRFNAWLALKVTHSVGSMTCAYIFACLSLVSLPAAIESGNVIVIVSWVAQTFLQLVLLSVILVGQDVSGKAADKRAEQTFNDAEAILHECMEVQKHLMEQDRALQQLLYENANGPAG